jgi:glycosyltransferase involved in cell wall biosynthesis
VNTKRSRIFLHAWTGNPEQGLRFVEERYPSAEISTLVHQELRESGWFGQFHALTRLKGRALVVYFRSLADVKEPEIFLALHMLHGCKETVLADESGNLRVITLKECVLRLPGLILALGADVMVLAGSWLFFQWMRWLAGHGVPRKAEGESPDVAYLYPYPLNRDFEGGAMTHFLGFLQGVAENGRSCMVLSGCRFPFEVPFPIVEIPVRRKRFVFAESLVLSYNWRFARQARKLLAGAKPGAIYQRHGRFVIAGVLLARALRVPLILEYNASEVWMAEHWDPARFLPWIRLAEEVMLAGASVIVTVSEVLRLELIERGLPAERIFVNPNGVDPSKFRPDCGDREKLRRRFGFEPQHVVATFAGTFGYWHGVEVLQKAIEQLFGGILRSGAPNGAENNLRFLFIGKGMLQAEMRAALRVYEERGLVVFAGMIPHEEMPSYLNLADILLSPHVPMPDGHPFFGSPTKLFEYMAMGKAIVASRLDQIEAVLEDNRTAVLVQPGNVDELAQAILSVAANAELRTRLGRNAREAARTNHTWKRNAAIAMSAAGIEPACVEVSSSIE